MNKKLLFSLLLFPFILSSQTFTNSVGGPILDVDTVSYSVNISGLSTIIDTSFGVSQVCVNLTHTYDSDLKIKLMSPNGTIILLTGNHGGGNDNYTNTCFAMDGVNGNIAGGAAPFTGTFISDNSLNLFNNNQNPNGNWTLIIMDEVANDVGVLLSFNITFAASPPADPIIFGPCSLANGAGCSCPDGSLDCDLLPDMTASSEIIAAQHYETPGLITLSNATPNIGWGPLEIHGTNSCWCDTVNVSCSTALCPDGSNPTQKLKQTIYHKSGNIITSYDTLRPGNMSYHPSHGHVHVNHWADFTLRTPTSNPDATTWPIVTAGTKVSYCLINLGTCNGNPNYCRDGNYGTNMTNVEIPNYGFGSITGCGYDQGIYVGNFDIYSSSLPGMFMDLTGVCNGDYYIVSITDPDNNFLETDETNNWAATPITLTQQNPLPVGSFTDTISGGSTVQFINPPSLTYSFQWFFGDGATSTNQNPVHTYTSNGMYAVTLIVSNNCGGDTVTHFVSVSGVTVGLGENAITTFGYSIYPNPSEDVTTVSYFVPEKTEVNFELFNMLGEKIYSISKGEQEQGHYEFNLQLKQIGLENGVYTFQLKTPTKSASVRLVQITN